MVVVFIPVVFSKITKTDSVESVEHIEQYQIKFMETSHYLTQRGHKAFEE